MKRFEVLKVTIYALVSKEILLCIFRNLYKVLYKILITFKVQLIEL